ncbi:MAG: hypothetical protein WBP63_00920, partial [Silvibacterium sp.]
RIRGQSGGQSMASQSGGDGFSVGAAGTASEVLNVVFFHIIEFTNAFRNDCWTVLKDLQEDKQRRKFRRL